jgi:Cdc6-like AAA superfamily ATPase
MSEESGRKLITPLIFNDEPVSRGETAYFQFEHYADTFARIIAARDTRTPLTIGVHGEWGSGKTTLMRRIQAKLDETKDWKTKPPSFVTVDERGSDFEETFRPCKTVWFNAWKYGREEALYAELADPKQDKLKVSEAVISTLARVFTAGKLDIDLTTFQTESRFRTNLAFLDEFQEVFDRLLRWYVARDRTAEGEFDDSKGVWTATESEREKGWEVLKGGSYFRGADSARVGSRGRGSPGILFGRDDGFRVCARCSSRTVDN